MSFLINNSRKKNNMTENDISHIDTNFTNNSNYSQKNLILKNFWLKDKISNKKKSIRKNYYETDFKIPSLILENNDSISSSNNSRKKNIKNRNKNKYKRKNFHTINDNRNNNKNKKNSTFFHIKSHTSNLNFNKSNLNENINLTLPYLKKEINNIHKFILNSPISTDERIIINNLKIKHPISNEKNTTNFNNFKTRIQPINNKPKKIIEENSKIYKNFINSVNNPSLGLEGIKKKFPNFANYVKNNLVFNKKYISKNFVRKM